jgi:DnaJ-class molecular chaperone
MDDAKYKPETIPCRSCNGTGLTDVRRHGAIVGKETCGGCLGSGRRIRPRRGATDAEIDEALEMNAALKEGS